MNPIGTIALIEIALLFGQHWFGDLSDSLWSFMTEKKMLLFLFYKQKLRLGEIKLWYGGDGNIVDGTQESCAFYLSNATIFCRNILLYLQLLLFSFEWCQCELASGRIWESGNIVCNSQGGTSFCLSMLYSVRLALQGILRGKVWISDIDRSCYLKLYDEDVKGMLLEWLLCSSLHKSGCAAMTSL